MIDVSNYVYVAITANFWGSGKTGKQALKSCKDAGGSSQIEKHGYILLSVHPDFEVSEIDGSVRTPLGHPAIQIRDARKKKVA